MGFLQTDQDYLDAGVDPPEHNPHANSQSVPFDQHIHSWVQLGNHIECKNGQHPHGQGFDHLNTILVGTSPEGAPIFKKLDISAKTRDDEANGDDRAKRTRSEINNRGKTNGRRPSRRRTNTRPK